jgi:hypothetical protein
MAERRMPEVVTKTCGLDYIRVCAAASGDELGGMRPIEEIPREGAPHLRHLEGVRHPVVKDMRLADMDHLGHPRQASERGAVENAVAVHLENRAPVQIPGPLGFLMDSRSPAHLPPQGCHTPVGTASQPEDTRIKSACKSS